MLTHRLGLTALALVSTIGFAAAQQPQPAPDQPALTSSQPPVNPGQAQGTTGAAPAQHDRSTTSDSGKTGKEEPSSHVQTSGTEVLVNGALAVPGAPADSQTVPAKFSQRNAALDELPIMAYPLPLDDKQKQRIYSGVNGTNQPVASLTAKLADMLEPSVDLYDLPKDMSSEIPAIAGLKTVKLADKILLVQAPNKIVVGEITR